MEIARRNFREEVLYRFSGLGVNHGLRERIVYSGNMPLDSSSCTSSCGLALSCQIMELVILEVCEL